MRTSNSICLTRRISCAACATHGGMSGLLFFADMWTSYFEAARQLPTRPSFARAGGPGRVEQGLVDHPSAALVLVDDAGKEELGQRLVHGPHPEAVVRLQHARDLEGAPVADHV